MALNARQEKFVQEYLANPNATQAAVRAGYSPKTAAKIGSENLQKREIQARIHEAMADYGIEPERVIGGIVLLGTSDLRDIAKWDERGLEFIPSEDLTPEAAASIKKVKSITTTDEDGNTRVTLEVEQYDKLRALELLGRRFKLFTDKVELDTGEEGFTIRLKGLPDKTRGHDSN